MHMRHLFINHMRLSQFTMNGTGHPSSSIYRRANVYGMFAWMRQRRIAVLTDAALESAVDGPDHSLIRTRGLWCKRRLREACSARA